MRESLSAALDGEASEIATELALEHIETCVDCETWQSGAAALHRMARVGLAPTVPDLTPSILVAIGASNEQSESQRGCRIVLALCALLQLAMTLPAAFATTGSIHLDHELGSWDLALGVGFLVAAWRPKRAWGMLPLVATVVLALLVTAAFDVANGNTTAAGESSHIIELMGLAFLWMTARYENDAQAATIFA